MNTFFRIIFFLFFFLIAEGMYAQCINIFPHVEDFETAPTWTAVTAPTSSVVASSDWAWGTPNHTYVIQGAASGNKCWCVGGLTGAFYNYWEESYVVSPCYDFTNLLYPHIKFKLFYDCEYHFDGGNLQYSLNGGVTWNDVGTVGGTNANPIPEPNDCNTQNWYNYPGIMYLNKPAGFVPSTHGWCGNTQAGGVGFDPANPTVNCVGGHGLGHWITAEHCLTGCAGQPNVLLRFTFGAGYTCNDFDGFAFDSVAVSNGISNSATFNHTCVNPNTLNFTATPNACPTNTYAWNFGDPASGPANTSATQNPSHTFSAVGTFTVTLFASGGACNPPDTTKQVVNIISATVTTGSVSCNGGNETVTALGTPPFTYIWSSGQTTSTVTNLSAGNYSVTVTSLNSCPVTLTVSITQPAAITSTVSTTNSSCSSSTGTSTVAVSGGSGTFTYSWSTIPVQSTVTATGLSAGSYSVLITDANGCTAIASVSVVNSNGPTATSAVTNVTCSGANNGSAVITAIGNGLTYNWIPSGGNSSSASGLSSGTFTCVITDASGCTLPQTVNITQPPILTASVSSTPVNCNNSGSAAVTASGGTGILTYLWIPLGGVNAVATGLSAGTYTVLITDANGCTLTATTIVNSITGMTVSLFSSANVSCNGGANGNATMNATGGTSPYTYMWSATGGTNATATGLSAGTYSCTITDANGCSQTQLANITQLPPITLSVTATPVPCGLANGTASVIASGGTAPYTYIWLTTPVQSSTQVNNLATGNYSVVVTDANGCNQIQTVNVPQNNASPHADFIFTPDIISWLDPSVNFINNSFNSSIWTWNFGDSSFSTQQNPSHTYSNIGTYCITLIVSDTIGTCKDSITKCLPYECEFTFYIPNTFTPNDDGVNEFFLAKGTCIQDFNLYLFDRWGNKIFQSNDINTGWDGKDQRGYSGKIVQEDVYVWKVHLTEYNGKKHDYIGHVSLIK